MRKRGHLEETGVDGKIIQKWIFKKWNWEHIVWIDLAEDTDM
jgi:hypothetical protein